MHRGSRKQLIFLDDGDRRKFLARLEVSFTRWHIELHGFALMGNHYHLLVRCPSGDLSKAMKQLNSAYAQDFNWRHGLDGHLFRGRFKSLLIGDDAYLAEVVRYIHRNPVEAGLVSTASFWPWSSHRDYLGEARKLSIETDAVLEYFGGDRDRFDAFVAASDSAKARSVIEALDTRRPAIGSPAFLAQLASEADRSPETAPSLAKLLRSRTDDVERQTMAMLALEFPELDSAARLDLVMWTLKTNGESYQALADRFDFASATTVSSRISRLKRRVSRDKRLGAASQRTQQMVSDTPAA